MFIIVAKIEYEGIIEQQPGLIRTQLKEQFVQLSGEPLHYEHLILQYAVQMPFTDVKQGPEELIRSILVVSIVALGILVLGRVTLGTTGIPFIQLMPSVYFI